MKFRNPTLWLFLLTFFAYPAQAHFLGDHGHGHDTIHPFFGVGFLVAVVVVLGSIIFFLKRKD